MLDSEKPCPERTQAEKAIMMGSVPNKYSGLVRETLTSTLKLARSESVLHWMSFPVSSLSFFARLDRMTDPRVSVVKKMRARVMITQRII